MGDFPSAVWGRLAWRSLTRAVRGATRAAFLSDIENQSSRIWPAGGDPRGSVFFRPSGADSVGFVLVKNLDRYPCWPATPGVPSPSSFAKRESPNEREESYCPKRDHAVLLARAMSTPRRTIPPANSPTPSKARCLSFLRSFRSPRATLLHLTDFQPALLIAGVSLPPGGPLLTRVSPYFPGFFSQSFPSGTYFRGIFRSVFQRLVTAQTSNPAAPTPARIRPIPLEAPTGGSPLGRGGGVVAVGAVGRDVVGPGAVGSPLPG